MRQNVLKLWRDTRGETSAAAMLLLMTILGLGAIAGLTTFRDQLVQELGDVAAALESVNQSYSISTVSYFNDSDTGAPSCLSLNVSASPES